MEKMDALEEFFGGRYISKIPWMSDSGWSWRDSSYDGGYEEVSREDLLKLYHLLGDYLMEQQ